MSFLLMDKKLLLYTAASGHYKDYGRLWHYCIQKSYPEYGHTSDGVIEGVTVPTYYAACVRLLLSPSDIVDHVYITDVDMMILREEPTLSEFHIAEMEKTGLCYSNTLRTNEQMGKNRMTGLMYVTQEWYARTKEVRESYKHMLDSGEIGNGRFDDELMLKSICEKSGVGLPPQTFPLLKRHHGIHLGTIRAYINHPKNTMDQQLRFRVSRKQAEQWLEFYKDPEFKDICGKLYVKNRVISRELEILYTFCRRLLNGKE